MDPTIFTHFAECDEIWHAGDIGTIEVADKLADFRPLKAVYGNIDGSTIRSAYPRDLRFECAGLDVFITHIGGYPGRYTKRLRQVLQDNPPGLYICGHSHILKVIYDKKHGVLHMNPGACGYVGFHKLRTLIRFSIEDGRPKDAEVVELGPRSIRGAKVPN